jgi:hypothetical protein
VINLFDRLIISNIQSNVNPPILHFQHQISKLTQPHRKVAPKNGAQAAKLASETIDSAV